MDNLFKGVTSNKDYMSIAEIVYQNSIKTLNCKTTACAYGIFDSNNNLIEIKERPNICGVPHCDKCAKERKGRLMKTYKPYFDAHDRSYVRHIICTLPVVKRSELVERIPEFFNKCRIFHERIRKTLGYTFNAFMVLETHYQKQSDSYNFHVHYGAFSRVNKDDYERLWRSVWNNDKLVVKYPQKNGKSVFQTKKYAFLEYMCRRRTEQAYTMPLEDYYEFVRNKQMLRRVGFKKGFLAVVTTLRNEDKLPDELRQIFLGNYDITFDKTRIFSHFKRKYQLGLVYDEDIITFDTAVKRLFEQCVEYGKPEQKQITLNIIANKKTL